MIKLVPYWRSAWRLWSVRFAAFGVAFWTYLLSSPETPALVWQSLPPEIQAFVPVNWQRYVTLLVFVLTLLARLVQQQKAQAVIEQKMAEKAESEESKPAE